MGLPLRIARDDLARSGEREINRESNPPEVRESFLRLVPREIPRLPAAMDVFGLPVTTATFEELHAWFYEAAYARGRVAKVMLFAGAASFAQAWEDAGHRERMASADAILPEGPGVLAYALLAAAPLRECSGAALTLHRLLASVDPTRPLRVFLVGKDKEALVRAGKAIEQRFAYVDVVGVADTRPDACLSERIAEECVDVVLVGVGSGRDELWIDENVDLLDVGVVAGVGHALDAIAGAPFAPPRATPRLGFFQAIRFLVRTTLYLALPWLRPSSVSALNG